MGKSFYMNEEMWHAKAHKIFKNCFGREDFLMQMRPIMHLLDDYQVHDDMHITTIDEVIDEYESHVPNEYNTLSLRKELKLSTE